jgi:PAS domain S-box-containing protein
MTIINEDLRSNGKKQAGQKAQGQLQLLSLVMNNIPQAVFWKDRDLVYLGCNQAFADDAGFASPEDIVGKTDFDMPWKDQADLYRADDRLVMESAKPKLNYEEPQTTPDGSRIWLSTSKIPVYENEHVVAVLGMYEDITERKRAEETLKEERQRFQTILETIRVPTIISRLSDGIVLYANEAIAQVSRVDLNKLIGFKTGSFYANPDDRKIVLESLRERGQINDFEVQFRRTDGSLYWALLSSRIVDYEGERCVLSTYIDITERKRTEEFLKQSEATLASALQVAQMGHWEFDLATQMFILNDQYYSLHGKTAQEVGGYQIPLQSFAQEFVWPGDAAVVGQATQQAIETTDPDFHVQTEARILHADGKPRWVTIWFRIEKDAQGQTIKLHGVNQDITARKELEAQVKEGFERRGLQVQLSTQVSQSIASAASLEELYERVVTQVKEQFGYYHTQLLRYDPAQEAVVLVTGYGEVGAKMLSAGHRLPMGEGLIGTAAATGESILRPTLESDPDWHPNPLLPETKGEIAVPIKLGETVLGVLDVQSSAAGALNTDDQLLLEGLCGQIATAIESTRLRQEMFERLEEIHRLYRAMSHEGWQTYQQTADIPSSFMFDQAGLRPVQAIDLTEELFANVPLVVPGGEVIGTLAIADDPERPLSPEDQALLAQIGEQVALALESARLFEQTQGALVESEEAQKLIRNVIDSTDDWIFVKDHEHRYRLVNQGYAKALHISVDEFIGKTDLELGFPEELVKGNPEKGIRGFWSDDRLVMDSGMPQHFPDDPATIDGRVHVFDTIKVPLRDASGTIWGVLAFSRDVTERKQAEEILRDSEARLSEALDIARLANWEYDVTRDRFIFNDHFYSIFHTTVEEVGGYEVSSEEYAKRFVHPDDLHLVGQEIEKALASTDRHYNVHLEHRILYKDGGVGYISADVHIERDEQGNIVRYYGANQDITERKLAEETIKAEQQRTQTILESVTIPMVITRLSDNHLTFVNRPAIEVTQYKYEEVINQPAPNFYYDAEDRKKFITELRAKGQVADMPVRLSRKSGEMFWALFSARIFNYQGEASILTTFVDITDRIRAEEAIAKRATELATVAQLSTTTSTVLDPDQLLQSIVDLTKERFGLYHVHIYLADESWKTLLLAAGAGEVGRKMVTDGWSIPMDHEQSIVASAARNRESIIANDVVRDANSAFLSNQLLPDTRSEMAVPMVVGQKLLGIFDVQANTADYFSEEDANIYTTLAAQVAVALQNARLYREQAATLTQLRELDKLKSSFLANMSHELRTPLNSILGFTDVIMEGLDGPLTEYMDNDLRLIQKNGQHLLHLINDVLDMAKIEAGRMNLNPENFKAFEVMEEVTSITSTLASEKNLSLFIDETSERDVEIYADRTRLRQVMINLVNNAIKFTDAGKVSLKVVSWPGARILISVQDTGIGIAPDKLDAIFQEFTQVDSSSTRKAGGTGLGLPISRRLVEMHGGRLWAESTGIPGEGSTFFVELPVEARITEVMEKQAS